MDLGSVRILRDFVRDGTDLSNSNFHGANFSNARLVQVVFNSTDLGEANLRDADLETASLYQADLRGADLTGANLKLADMDEAQTEGAIFCNTRMPDGTTNNSGCP